VLDERQPVFEAAMLRCAELRGKLAKTLDAGANRQLRGQLDAAEAAAREAFLGIKVCDPAMGSGHFLVNAVDFLADGIIQRMQAYHDSHADVPWEWNPILQLAAAVRRDIVAEMARQGISLDPARLDDTSLLTRLVMKRCIYGVDLNRMAVELAKLSLWLHSFTVGAPLSFLDHHLRWGNSLIGADVRTVEAAIAATDSDQMALWGGPFAGLLDLTAVMTEVAGRADATLADVRRSADEFDRFQRELTPYKQALDLWVSQYFEERPDRSARPVRSGAALELLTVHGGDVLPALRGERELAEKYQAAIAEARRLWEEKRFFHWDLEFPEVFVDLARRDWAENPGFDAVIGNPPYDELSEVALGRAIEEKDFFANSGLYKEAVTYRINLYRLFIALALKITQTGGRQGFIVPMSLLGDRFTRDLRRRLLIDADLQRIEAFPQKDDPHNRVFFEAKLPTCLYILCKQSPQSRLLVRTHPGKEIIDTSPAYQATADEITRFEPDNQTIPLVDHTSWNLAVKIALSPKMRRLGDVARFMSGEVVFNLAFRPYLTENSEHTLVLRGGHVQRYELIDDPRQGTPVYIDKERWLSDSRPGSSAFAHRQSRIVFQESAALDNWRRIIATLLPAGQVCGHKICYFVDVQYDPMALLAIFNSSLIEWRFGLVSTTNNLSAYQIEAIPMPTITFTTPATDRARLAEEARQLYAQFAAAGDPAPILAFVAAHLSPAPASSDQLPASGRSDVVHDLLAHLAEQMIATNKTKQAEVKGFLAWLGREIGAAPDTLTGRSRLTGYLGDYQKGEPHLTLDELLDILRKNRRKLAVDPSARAFQERLAVEYEASLGKLLPIKGRLAAADRLIDQVVYRLYGLTEDEIAVVEGKK
jgi:hypothetical protein